MQSRQCALTNAPGQPENLNVTKSNPRWTCGAVQELGVPLPVLHALITERPRDRWTAQQVAMVVPWVSYCPLLAQCGLTVEITQTYVKRFPYKPPTQRSGEARSSSDSPLNAAGGRDASALSPSPTDVAIPLTPVSLYLPYSLPFASLSSFQVPLGWPSPLPALLMLIHNMRTLCCV